MESDTFHGRHTPTYHFLSNSVFTQRLGVELLLFFNNRPFYKYQILLDCVVTSQQIWSIPQPAVQTPETITAADFIPQSEHH